MMRFRYLLFGLLQCTWGCIQTAAGLVVFLMHIRQPHMIYRGCIVTKWNTLSGLSLGLFLFTADANNRELEKFAGGTHQALLDYANRILVHEYGHAVQSLMLGPLMLIPGILSIFWGQSKKCQQLRHIYKVPYTFCWVEHWASALGERFTGESAVW